MSSIDRLDRIAAELERLSGYSPADALRREPSMDAKLRRVYLALAALPIPVSELDDLTDVAGTPTAGQVLTFSGTAWAPADLPAAASLELNDLTDVSGTPTLGQVLTFDGSSWSPDDASGGATVLSGLNDVTGTPSSGQVLTYNGSSWAPATPAAGGGGEVCKQLTAEMPDDAEDISFFFINTAITVNEMRVALVGDTTPSITWTVKHATDRSAAGTTVKAGTTTSITSGDDLTTFADDTIPADSFIWLETSGQSGNVYEITIALFYEES